MEQNNDLRDAVIGWVESSGRALELRVARSCMQGGAAQADQSFEYTDITTQKRREGDVRAKFTWTGQLQTPCSLTAIIECKSGKEKPWVGMYDGPPLAVRGQLENLAAFVHGPFSAITDPLPQLWAGMPPFISTGVATHVVTALGKDTGNNPDPAADALRQAMSAVEAERASYISSQFSYPRGLVVIPVIVTNAPLFQCYVDQRSALHVEPVDSLVVSAPISTNPSSWAFIIAESQVSQLATSMADLAHAAQIEADEANRRG